MSATYESKSSATLALTATQQQVTLPTGTAEGDLLLCHFVQIGASGSTTYFNLADGSDAVTATQYDNADGFHAAGLKYKFATASDISNGYVLVNGSNVSTINARITLYRVSGVTDGSQIQADGNNAAAETTSSYNIGLTPTIADSLLMIFTSRSTSTSADISGYSIATDNPTWNEITDERIENLGGSADDPNIGVAWATRTATTVTGNVSVTYGALADSFCMLAVIAPTTNVSLTLDPSVLTLTAPEMSLVLDTSVSLDTASLTLSSPEQTITTEEYNVWTEQNKNSSIWTNQDK